jgi:long-chain acyl-CoA synthetase
VEELKNTDSDRHFSFYSPAWIVEQHDGIATSMVSSQVTYFPEGPDTAINDMREVGPTIFFAATRIWEGLASTIQVKITDASWIKRFVYALFLPLGGKMADFTMKREKPGLLFRLLHKLADLIVFARLRDRMGLLKVRAAVTAGALLSPEAFRYFWSLGIPIRQSYGLTEIAPITLHRGDDIDRNTDGLPITNVEVKVDEEGEILVRGKGLFVGYYKNEDATEEALRNGWFHTGDWGNINERGHIVVFDRLKDAVSLKSGHKFAPQYIESQLKFSPYINDAVVIGGENYDYVTVIINIEFANVSKWADKNHINYLTFTDLSQKDEVYDLIHEEIKKVNRNLPPETRVKRFANLYKQLDPDEAELTRTRKVKRKVFEERYRPVIDGLYGDERFVEVETEVRYRDGKVSLIKTSVKIRDV